MRLILVRHGQTHSNTSRALDTAEPGAALTNVGREQADALVELLEGRDVAVIARSHLLRTEETAAPLAESRGLEPVVDPRLREVLAGDMEMATDDGSVRAYLETMVSWAANDLDVRIPGGESGHEVLQRFDDAIADLERDAGDGTVVVVTHGAIMRVWSAVRGVNVPEGWAAVNVVTNTGLIELVHEDDQWWVERWMTHELPREPRSSAAAR